MSSSRPSPFPQRSHSRRAVLRLAIGALAAGGLVPAVWYGRGFAVSVPGAPGLVASPDVPGLLVPPGVKARVVARSGLAPVPGGYRWHEAPDGGAVFPVPAGAVRGGDGGWVYVSNSELSGGRSEAGVLRFGFEGEPSGGPGGVGALRFDKSGRIAAAYPILSGTHRNCSGGATPWGTWLSCEEVPHGRVWECDPLGRRMPMARPALGVFSHEAVAVDPVGHRLYLTEDEPDGLLYRFTPDRWPQLTSGTLEAARAKPVTDGQASSPAFRVTWRPVPDPTARRRPTRHQVPGATPFRGGEGIAWHGNAPPQPAGKGGGPSAESAGGGGGTVWFSTKGDDRIWAYQPATGRLAVRYDASRVPNPLLTGVDNVTVAADGTVLVAEDGGDMQVIALYPAPGPDTGGLLVPRAVAQVRGHPDSEVTGIALDPSGTRLYFSSQRGATGRPSGGITYELSGPLLG